MLLSSDVAAPEGIRVEENRPDGRANDVVVTRIWMSILLFVLLPKLSCTPVSTLSYRLDLDLKAVCSAGGRCVGLLY